MSIQQTTVESRTQLKTVKITLNIFAVYGRLKQETPQVFFNNIVIPLERGSGQKDCWPDVSIVLNHFYKDLLVSVIS